MEISRPLRRTMHDRQIAGVCGGLARFLDLDPTVVRVVYALATVCTAFSGLLVYLILWAVVPARDY